MSGGRILFSIAFLLLLAGEAAFGANGPARLRIGGLTIVEGEVATRLPASGAAGDASRAGAWSEAGRNDPVIQGMAVRTEASARAVVRVGADLIAIVGGSEADIVKLDGAGMTIALRRGRLGVRLSELDADGAVEITIPSGVLRLSAPGEYDIAAGDAKFPARVAVPAGEARFSGEGLDAVVATGAGVLLSGDDRITMLPGSTDDDMFAGWWREQKRDAGDSPALHYVSAAITGHELLDEHGAWETVAGLGAVWFPSDAPRGWVPYRFGHWRWIRPWGWTWIDDMQWGFTTSHYGRWAKVGVSDSEAGRWGWVPGERIEEPGFMPAAVAFLGTAGVGLSYPDAFSPAVAWFPLAPDEVYWPSFTDDPEAIRRLNAGAVADLAAIGAALKGNPPAAIVTGQYRNRRHATVVPRPIFVNGKSVADAVIELPERRLENAPMLAGSPSIEPAGATPPVKAAAELARHGVAANSGQGPRRAHPYRELARAKKSRRREARVEEAGSCPREARDGALSACGRTDAIAGSTEDAIAQGRARRWETGEVARRGAADRSRGRLT